MTKQRTLCPTGACMHRPDISSLHVHFKVLISALELQAAGPQTLLRFERIESRIEMQLTGRLLYGTTVSAVLADMPER